MDTHLREAVTYLNKTLENCLQKAKKKNLHETKLYCFVTYLKRKRFPASILQHVFSSFVPLL